MKNLLLLTLVASAPFACAMSLKDAQDRLSTSQSRIDEIKQKIARFRSEAESAQQRSASFAGQEKKGHEVNGNKEASRAATKAHNEAVAELRKANAELAEVLAQAGKHHTITSQGEKYSVSAAPAPQKAGASYSSQPRYTESYSSESRMPYQTSRTARTARTVYGR